jgi:hypothetical protein
LGDDAFNTLLRNSYATDVNGLAPIWKKMAAEIILGDLRSFKVNIKSPDEFLPNPKQRAPAAFDDCTLGSYQP